MQLFQMHGGTAKKGAWMKTQDDTVNTLIQNQLQQRKHTNVGVSREWLSVVVITYNTYKKGTLPLKDKFRLWGTIYFSFA